MLAVAEMYVKSVSTRQAEAVLREFGIEDLSSSQVSRAAACTRNDSRHMVDRDRRRK